MSSIKYLKETLFLNGSCLTIWHAGRKLGRPGHDLRCNWQGTKKGNKKNVKKYIKRNTKEVTALL